MRELFVYYKIPGAQVDTARGIADALMARLRERFPGLTARLLRRPEQDDPQTWMEVYALPQGDGVTAEIEAAIAAEGAALDGFMIGGRHVEAFVPCAS